MARLLLAGSGRAGRGKNLPVDMCRNKTFLPVYRQFIDRNGCGLPWQNGKNIMKMACYVKK